MKISKPLLFPLLGFLTLTSLFSCGEDRWKEYYPQTGRDLWIDSVMREVYLWHEDIPSSKNLNYFQAPEAFLKKILSKNDKGFSAIDTLPEMPLPGYGFNYKLYKTAHSDSTYNALVSHVAASSPAEEAGLQRGNWIMLADGDSITKRTEKRLTEGAGRTLRIGKYVAREEEGNNGDAGFVQETGDITLPAARSITESAVHATALVQLEGTGQKIAYLAYNIFASGSAEDDEKYNNELRDFSQVCQQNGINNFVLDLRYNAGGEMECVQLLADLLAPADKLGSHFATLQYNDKQSNKNRDLTLGTQLAQGGVNLNLSKLYVITGGTTAGAAEMLVNCLKPYMEIILIGQTTKGEYVGTETFVNPHYRWTLRTAVCEVFNAEGKADYQAGFKPDVPLNEMSYLQYYLPLGNPNELLFNTALGIIA